MKVTTETVATKEVLLTIEPEPQQVEQAMRRAARQISRWRPVPGFRPGKAPYALVERIFTRDVILDEAVHEMAPDLYRQALEEAKLEPYEQGQLDVASKEPLVLKVNLPLAPTVALGDYRNLHTTPEPEVAVTEAQIDEQVERVRRQHAEFVTVERPALMGDQVIVALQGTSNGESVLQQDETTFTLDDKLPPPGFAEALVGMQANETRTFVLAYPQDYADEQLAGKEVEFTVTLKTVRQVNLPEVNDDLAKMAGDYDTLTQMREGLAADLKRFLEYQAREREANAALDTLVQSSTIEYPAAALKREVDGLVESQISRLRQIGFTFDNYLRTVGRTEEQFREDLRPEAERRLVRRLVLTEFARAEELELGDAELTGELTNIAAAYGDRAEQVLGQLRNRNAMLSVYANALTRKALERLTLLLTGRQAVEEQQATVDAGAAPAEAPASDAAGEQPAS